MARRLPPLNSLKAFEAAARRLSFTLAADELHVTQAAISHQVKSLEEYLQTPLFVRYPRKLELTEPGEALMHQLSKCFDEMDSAISGLLQQHNRQSLKLRMGSAFAAKWMSPRLPEFSQQYPEIDLSFNYSQVIANFDSTNVDICITFGNGEWPGLEAYPIIHLDFFPVCSPALVHRYGDITSPHQLADLPLLHDLDYYTWTQWLLQVGADDINPRRGSILDDSNVLMQAAIDGQGVAMCSTALVSDHLAAGHLVRLFDDTFVSRWAYHLAFPSKHANNPSIIAFRDWLLTHVDLNI